MLVLLAAYFLYFLIFPQYNADQIIGNLTNSSCEKIGNNLTCYLTNDTNPIIKYDNNNTRVDILQILIFGVPLLDLDIIIPINVTSIYLENHSKYGPLVMHASATNNVTRRIKFQRGAFFLNQTDNFFTFFPRIQVIQTSNSYLQFGFQPSFVTLKSLECLELNIMDPKTLYSNFTSEIVQNLTNLTRLTWSGNLKNIEPGSLDGLFRLTYLDLRANMLTDLPSKLFKENNSIKTLILDRNLLSNFTSDFFENLDKLTYLSLNYNPNFTINSLIKAESIQWISLQSNVYTYLSPMAFQQLPNLKRIYLDGNPFRCSCELRWASIVESYGIEIIGGRCLNPLSVYNIAINDGLPYTNCDSTEKYECFGKNVSCPGEKLCIDTANTYICRCLEGYAYENGSCNDIDECSNSSICQANCTNTQGSYECACNDGYELNSNGTCDDVNECFENNGGCPEWCQNTPGSYQCCGIMNIYCLDGYFPFILWGSVASGLVLLFLIILITVVIKSRSRKPKFENLENRQPSIPSLTASYTKMDPVRIEQEPMKIASSTPSRPIVPINKPLLPPNKPSLPRPRRTSSQEPRREIPSYSQDDELNYEVM